MATHRIQRQFIDVTTEHSVDAFAFRQHLAELCSGRLLPAIEKLFDAKAPDGKLIHGEKLVIDVGELPKANWEAVFVDRVLAELTKCISTAAPGLAIGRMDDLNAGKSGPDEDVNILREISAEENIKNSVLHFLKNGTLPWFSFIKSRDALNDAISRLLVRPDFIRALRKLFHENRSAGQRLVFQFNESITEYFIVKCGIQKALLATLKSFWLPFLEGIGGGRETGERNILYAALINFVSKEPVREFGHDIMLAMLQNVFKQIPDSDKPVVRARMAVQVLEYNGESYSLTGIDKGPEDDRELFPSSVSGSEDKVWYISNAGLVLLHPFLTGLFTNTGYIDEENKWVSEEVRYRALALTQHLLGRGDEFPEFDIVLNKILTGYPLNETVPGEIALSDFEKNEARDLLGSVVKHWTALRNTSIDGLQATFLARQGKLTMGETGWVLQVEQKTVDILLNKLPWGFSIVKTPWMDKMIHVEWT